MIAKQELRTGNYVQLDNEVYQVTQILWNRAEVCKGDTYVEAPYEQLEPIDATLDVLEKLDLEKVERFHFSDVFKTSKGNFTINQLRDNTEISFSVSSTPAIVAKGNFYVHQVQNLYFALHNKELEIRW